MQTFAHVETRKFNLNDLIVLPVREKVKKRVTPRKEIGQLGI